MTVFYLPHAVLWDLIDKPGGIPTFTPIGARHTSWMALTSDAGAARPTVALAESRPSQSPKGFFLPAAESMGHYGSEGAVASAVQALPCVLVGVRACDLVARNYLDKVMLDGPFPDPLYAQRREATTIVSCDCTDCAESCFCTSVGGRPFPVEGFDVNLSAIEGGYVAEVGTQRGRQWLGAPDADGVSPATSEHLAQRDELRHEMTKRVQEQNAQIGLDVSDQTPLNLPQEDDKAWGGFAADCVECGACTNICPTCHCFYLYDQMVSPEGSEGFLAERIRTWDSCVLSSYHRMAGGAGQKLTQKPNLFSRLANRVLHKFTYSPQQYGMLGCVGCGRCVDACLGAIDIRQVVQELRQ